MLNMLRLHWTVNRRLLLQVLPLFAFWLLLSLGSLKGEVPKEGFFASICLMMGVTLTAIVTLQGITQGVEPFLLALPISRRQLTSSAYLAGLLAGLCGLSLPLLVALCVPRLAVPDGITGTLALLYALIGLGLFLLLPLRFLLGGEKGLTAFALLLGLMLLLVQLSVGLAEGFTRLGDLGLRILEHPKSLGLGCATVWIGLGLISWWLACRVYEGRRF